MAIKEMALTSSKITSLLILATMFWAFATAQSSNDCSSVLLSLSPCLNYISGNSSNPSTPCCTQLSTVVNSQPQCLCQVLNGGGSNMGLNINQTQAMELPKACNVQTPPVSKCNVASPTGSPSLTPNTPSANTGGGSKTVPSTVNPSDATTTKLAASVLLFSILFTSVFNMA